MAGPFRGRPEAVRVLGGELAEYAGQSDVIVPALPRCGVPVDFALHAP
jgi:predicted phosphoribosyltransferase